MDESEYTARLRAILLDIREDIRKLADGTYTTPRANHLRWSLMEELRADEARITAKLREEEGVA